MPVTYLDYINIPFFHEGEQRVDVPGTFGTLAPW
jgi:hypothetical protein